MNGAVDEARLFIDTLHDGANLQGQNTPVNVDQLKEAIRKKFWLKLSEASIRVDEASVRPTKRGELRQLQDIAINKTAREEAERDMQGVLDSLRAERLEKMRSQSQ